MTAETKECRCCHRVPDAATPNGNHKMSCLYGLRYQTKVTMPIAMENPR